MERHIGQIKYVRTGLPWEEGPGAVRSDDIADEMPDAVDVIFATEDIIARAKRKEFIENMNA